MILVTSNSRIDELQGRISYLELTSKGSIKGGISTNELDEAWRSRSGLEHHLAQLFQENQQLNEGASLIDNNWMNLRKHQWQSSCSVNSSKAILPFYRDSF